MEPALAQRIAQLIARYHRERALPGSPADQSDRERRQARDRVVAELHRFASMIASTVEELNDRISETGMRVKFETADQLPSAEAVYTFTVVGLDRDGPLLTVSIDYKGALRGILHNHEARSLVLSSTVFELGEAELLGAL